MGTKTGIVLALMWGVLQTASAQAPVAATTPDAVFACMRANIPQSVRIQTVEVRAYDRSGGERLLRGRIFGTREDNRARLMMRVEAPPDLARAAYLIRESEPADEMYMYLPALNKTRRITGAAMDGKLWGTDLSYADLKQIQNAFTGAGVTLEAPGEIDGRPVHILHFSPREQEPSRYQKIRTHVDQKTCVALKVEFFEGGTVRKQMTVAAADLKQAGPHWYAALSEMKDLKEGSRTLLKITGLSAGDKLSARYFNPIQFYQGN